MVNSAFSGIADLLPTSGIGRRTALELAKQGTVVLVGRDRGKLDLPTATEDQLT
jgi:NAD(P)-dependent dehydrogenase (short-subunit alcohol dehydrogenase family)